MRITNNQKYSCERIYVLWETEKKISSQVYFEDFADRFGTTCLKNGFLQRYFSRPLLIDFTIATYLKKESSQKHSWWILFTDFKSSTTKLINF